MALFVHEIIEAHAINVLVNPLRFASRRHVDVKADQQSVAAFQMNPGDVSLLAPTADPEKLVAAYKTKLRQIAVDLRCYLCNELSFVREESHKNRLRYRTMLEARSTDSRHRLAPMCFFMMSCRCWQHSAV